MHQSVRSCFANQGRWGEKGKEVEVEVGGKGEEEEGGEMERKRPQ